MTRRQSNPQSLTWKRRRQVKTDRVATYRTRWDESKTWAIIEITSHFYHADTRGRPRRAYRVLAIRQRPRFQQIISRHKTAAAAARACEKAARKIMK